MWAIRLSSSRGGMSVVIFDPWHVGEIIDDVVSRNELREIGQRILDSKEAA